MHLKPIEKFVLFAVRITDRTVCNWFERFCGRNWDVKDLPPSGRSLTKKADEILQLIAIDRHAI